MKPLYKLFANDQQKILTLCIDVVSEIENVSTYESNLTAFFGGGFFLGHKEHIFCELVVVGGII